MSKLKIADAEYVIQKDPDNPYSLGLCVISKSLNGHVCVRITDKFLRESTVESLINLLDGMESSLVYQKMPKPELVSRSDDEVKK